MKTAGYVRVPEALADGLVHETRIPGESRTRRPHLSIGHVDVDVASREEEGLPFGRRRPSVSGGVPRSKVMRAFRIVRVGCGSK